MIQIVNTDDFIHVPVKGLKSLSLGHVHTVPNSETERRRKCTG